MMKKCKDRWALLLITSVLVTLAGQTAQAAIALDRTRAIFNGGEKNLILNISNDNQKEPYLAQAWLEDAQGNKLTSYLRVMPPVQRVEPGAKSVIRITALPSSASLPQDRESVFYFSVREIPPRSDRTNVLQLALQTRIKLFYRPASIIPERFSRHDDQLVLHKVKGGFRVENPTPYYMTLLGIISKGNRAVEKSFVPVMIAPMSSETVKSSVSRDPQIITINDFGGKPVLPFLCQGSVCRANPVAVTQH
ncbi:fimbrial biogenesis chaperone [Pantoea ananatis]